MTHVDKCMQLLQPFFDGDGAWLWLHLPQPQLGGAIPVDLIRAGDGQRVLDVIHHLRDSVYV